MKGLTYNGETLSQREWGRRLGIRQTTISKRFIKGLPVEEILRKVEVKIIQEGHRTCSMCKIVKPLDDFYSKTIRGRTIKDSRCKRCHVIYTKKHRNKDSERLYRAKWNKTHPEQFLARHAVYRALRTGILVKPKTCESCKEEKRLQAHHDDYTKKLSVRWLCSACHCAHHALSRGGKR